MAFGKGIENAHAVAMASLALNMILMAKLVNSGALPKQELTEVIDAATVMLEEMGLQHSLQADVHDVLQSILAILQGQKPS